MNLRRLKRPEANAPQVLVDLFLDLRDRRLLPLVALILVATGAAPLLLSSSGPGSAGRLPGGLVGSPEGKAAGARLTVVQSHPGLRDPRKRLGHLAAKDPFVQHYAAPVIKPGAGSSSRASTTTSDTTVQAVGGAGSAPASLPTGAPAPSSPGGEPVSQPPSHGKGGSTGAPARSTFAVDVKVTRIATATDGTPEAGTPEVRRGMMPLTALPNGKAEVVTYVGVSPETGKPLFLVSGDVESVFGDARCVAGSDVCQLLELTPGYPETFDLGPRGVRYKVNVIKVYPATAGGAEQSRATAQSFSK